MIIAALLFAAQVTPAETVATCRVPSDPQQRTWSLERVAPSAWRVVFTAPSLDKPRVELPLAEAQPAISGSRITLAYASANGGRALDWRIVDGFSTIDLRVSHGLEVNVERDLDPAVDVMNTDGVLSVVCNVMRLPNPPRGPSLENDAAFETFNEVRRLNELIVSAGVARSVNLYQSVSGRAYAVQTIGYSRELTGELKLIGIRGRFAWGVEAMPVFAQFEPSRVYGVGFAPVVWRWNFPAAQRWSAFAELSMGGMWTSEPIPDKTSRGNFTAHWGGGIRIRSRTIQARPGPSGAFVVAYRFQHFSNGNQLGSNPGVNSHVILAGWSHRS